MINESSILKVLGETPGLLPPVWVMVEKVESRPGEAEIDAIIAVQWRERTFRFAVEVKRLGTPMMVRQAMDQIRRICAGTGLGAMVVVPYLSPAQLGVLEREGISGIDLCGNGVVVVPGELLVYRTGQPNAYPASTRIRNVYQGTSSMISRAFLAKSRYETVGDVLAEVQRRGAKVSLSTVSKVLQSLAESLIIRREGRASRLLQAEELLEKLAANFESPVIEGSEQFVWNEGKLGGGKKLAKLADSMGVSLVMTGAASVNRYAVMPKEKKQRFYCSELGSLLKSMGDRLTPGRRFADIELLETRDPVVFFDARGFQGLPFASPVQCWLELQAGDKREQDAARVVRRSILKEAGFPVEGNKSS